MPSIFGGGPYRCHDCQHDRHHNCREDDCECECHSASNVNKIINASIESDRIRDREIKRLKAKVRRLENRIRGKP